MRSPLTTGAHAERAQGPWLRPRSVLGYSASMAAESITIRAFRETDGEALRALWREVGFRLTGDDDQGLARFAARNPGLFLVAEAGAGKIVGSAMGGWDGRRGWLYHVAAAADVRRAGLATELVRRVEAGLRALGCPRALVIVEAGNSGGLAFWRSQGYEPRDSHHLGKTL
jgi:ribosomal protein S18 acetylase RimI-like enzyme